MLRNQRPPLTAAQVAAVVAGTVAVVVAFASFRPFDVAVIGSDSQSSVLYFQRIAGGEQLERFLGTTPKPLLTLLYGSVHKLAGDWRPVSWLAIAAYGLAIGMTTLLVGRQAGLVGATFVAVALIASPQLFLDVSLAYAVSWALLGVAVAGLAVNRDRPRWAVAGLALAFGALARQEVFVLIGACLAIVAARWLVDARRGSRRLPPSWPLVVALVALPLTLVHDWLLTGDPLYFLAVPAIGAEGRDVASAREAMAFVRDHLAAQAGLVLLAGAGAVVAIRERAWPFVIGLAVMGPGMAAFVVFVAARGYVLLPRYVAPVDIALVVAAAIGAASVARWAMLRQPGGPGTPAAQLPADGSRRRVAGAVALVAALVAPLVLGPGIAPLDAGFRAAFETNRVATADWESMRPAAGAAIDAFPPLTASVPPADPWSRELSVPAFLVSAGLLPRATVDLGLHLDRAGRLESFATPESLAGTDGSLLALLTGLSERAMETEWLLSDPPTAPEVTLVPITELDDRARLIRVDAAAGP